jgi:DNA-directed RNA polymerase subunit beta'
MKVPIEDVKYMQVGPYDTMSPARMQIPFSEHSAQKRILMGSNHHKQAVAPINNERPIVSSGGDSLIDDGIITAEKLLSEYYDAQEGTIGVPKEEFLKARIKLVSVDTVKNFKVLGLEILDYKGHVIKTEIPFMQKASSGAMFSYIVNNESLEYAGKDVVAYSSDYDIRKYNIYKHTNFGNMKVDESKFERALGLAKNLVVGWKTHESSTIDDAIVIRQGLTDMNGYTTIELHAITYELKNEESNRITNISESEYFGFGGKSHYPHLNDNGLPKIGTVLQSGEVVLVTRIEKREHSRASASKIAKQHLNPVVLEGKQEGQVVFAGIEGKEARILLANVKHIEKGDKMSGRHGNKGVIAKILPDHLMPFDPETGLVLDVVLNPLGIPSRSNISQLLEALLGFAMKKKGQICVVSPFKGDTLEFVKNMGKEVNIHPMIMRDGRTGKMFDRPINVGVMYMLQLEHKVSSKMKGIGISGKLDPVFNQPSKGGGGQAFGEYETWVLMAVGANKVLQDLFSIQSDDLRAINVLRNSIMEGADSFEIEGNNNNDHIFQVLMRSLCVEPKIDQEGNVSFHPMTDKEIRALSLTPVDIYDKNSLGSEEIFGPTSNSMAKLESRVRWSWMPLHCEIVHPFHIIKTKIYKYLLIVKREGKEFSRYKLSEMTDTVVRDIISCKAFVELAPFEGKRRYVVTYGDTQGKLTGFKALVEMLRNADLDDIRAYHKRLIAESSSELTIMKSKKMLRNLEDFEASGHKLTDFIISSIPVIPLSFRPKSKFEHIQQDFDYYYGRIMDEVYSYKTSASKSEEDVFKIFLRIVEFCGLPFKGYTKETSQYKPLIKYFTGRESSDKKHGRLRENVLKKRVLFSGRTVIVPSGDIKRPPTKIGIPYALCIKVWGPYIVRLLSDMFFRLNLSENLWRELLESTTNKLRFARLVAKYGIKDYPVDAFYDKIYGIVCNYVEGYRNPETGEEVIKPKVVIAGRQPSLHKFSIRAYHPVIVEGKAIEIHPIVCGAYNADFDGDQMWFAALVNESACEEAIRLLSPKEGVINPKDGSLALEHSQDIRLGVYYATMLRDNVDNIKKHPSYDLSNLKYYNSVGTLEADIELGLAHVHDLVCFNYEGRSYLSTAGRILFNSLIPKGKGFTKDPFSNVLGIEGINTECYNDLKFDGLISGNGGTRKTPKYLSLGKITRWSYTEFDADANLEFFQKVSEFGFKHSDMSGISLSLDDLKEHPDTQKFIDRANEYAEIINRRYYNGSLSDEERKEELIYLYSKLKEKISERFMDTFDRNNNMFIIYDSGARGNKDQIMQACGIIGVLQKSKDEVLETPVLSNYTKGASCFETLQLSFSTRTGVASTQNETSVSGELTRLAVYMASGFRIVEEDCGAEAERVKVKYGDPLGVVLGPNGEKCTIQDLRGKQVLGDSSVLKKLQPFLDRLGRITDKSLEVLLKKKITNVKCEDGTYQILYKMDTMMSSFLNLRYAEGLEGLKDGKYITEATIASIERKGLTHVRMRNILACRSTGGCCAKCYGLKYDTLKLPRIGEFVGVESAQSIGEPASQLTLSLFHKGGAAGASVDKGVELYSSTLKSGFPKNLKAALLAPKEGHVHIDTVGKYVFVEDEVVGFTSENLTVDDGEHVDKWEPLTSGFVMPSEEVMNPTLEYIRFVQMSLLEVHFRIFEVNNIKVNARHFEIFARLQTSLVTIYESNDPEFKVGEDYEFNKIWNKGALDKVRFIFKVSKDTEVIRAFGGLLTQMAHGHLSDTLGRAVLGSKVSKTNSLISMLMQGRNVSTGAVKLLNPPKYMGVVTEVPITKEDDNKVANILVSGDIIEEITQAPVDPFSDVDWGDLLGSPEIAEPTEPTKEVYIKLDEEEVGEEKEVREVKKMDLFN